MSKGRVYIVRNPLFPTLFKIGFTTKNSVKERGLDASNVPEAFKIIREYECDDCEETEKLFHQTFEQFRYYSELDGRGKRTEFFTSACLANAIAWMDKLKGLQDRTDDATLEIEIEADAEEEKDKKLFDKSKIIDEPLTRSQAGRFDFWSHMNEYIKTNNINLKSHSPSYDHWYDFSLGSSKYWLSVNLLDRKGQIRVLLWIANDKSVYDKIYEYKEELENRLGKLEWDRKDEAHASWIATYIDGFSFDNRENWDDLFPQIIKKVSDFSDSLKPILK